MAWVSSFTAELNLAVVR